MSELLVVSSTEVDICSTVVVLAVVSMEVAVVGSTGGVEHA